MGVTSGSIRGGLSDEDAGKVAAIVALPLDQPVVRTLKNVLNRITPTPPPGSLVTVVAFPSSLKRGGAAAVPAPRAGMPRRPDSQETPDA